MIKDFEHYMNLSPYGRGYFCGFMESRTLQVQYTFSICDYTHMEKVFSSCTESVPTLSYGPAKNPLTRICLWTVQDSNLPPPHCK